MPGHGLLVDDIVLSARRCAAFAAAHRLACWVGEGVRVTPKQVLRPVDVPAAAQALGIPAPASGLRMSRSRSMVISTSVSQPCSEQLTRYA
ncbi:MAG: hypothetical protein ACRDRK_16900 [Pseudonocardia sp.]